MGTPIIQVKNLQKFYNAGKLSEVRAIDDVSFDVFQGETFGIAGESGSGKTTTGKLIMKLEDITGGSIEFLGKNIHEIKSRKETLQFRKNIQMIFQDPFASLNPRLTIKEIIGGPLELHHMVSSKKERDKRVGELLEEVGLSANFAERYPTEFSGGQCQRIDIARAIALKPKIIIADEAISALDVSIQAQIVNLMRKLKREVGLTYIFIAHDLSMVKYISDRIAVMNRGKVLELGDSETLYRHPLHPYTKSLLSAVPIANPITEKNRKRIIYNPDQHQYKDNDECGLFEIGDKHYVYCSKQEIEGYKRQLNNELTKS
ncbi:MAG: ATP-binding cassette domain-containing protein [Liquorilactobacillus satsumensis]|nr:ATP-binding cassette domain-containing protein [Liquorilactobacillus satsumensis]